MKAIITDNFFTDFDLIKESFKEIPLYDEKTFNKKGLGPKKNQSWPGKRSAELSESNPFLYNLIKKEFFEKFGYVIGNRPVYIESYIHLRLQKDEAKDWVHKDLPDDFSFLVYLSDTNLDSGTCLYEEQNGKPSLTVNFLQNRALLFDSNQWHRSMNNHGHSINDGRLTLNCFIRYA